MRVVATSLVVGLTLALVARASAAEPGDVRATFSEIFSFNEARGSFWSVGFSPDGKLVAAAYSRVSDSPHDQILGKQIHGLRIFSLEGNSARLDVGTPDQCIIVPRDAAVVEPESLSRVLCVRESPSRVLSVPRSEQRVSVGTVGADGVEAAKQSVAIDVTAYKGPLALSWATQCLVTCGTAPRSDEFGNVHGDAGAWDLESGKGRWRHEWSEGGYYAIAFSPDAKLVAAGGGHVVPNVMVLESGERHVGGGDKFRGRLQMWEAQSGNEVFCKDFANHQIESLAFSPDGKSLLSGGIDGVIRKWSVETGESADFAVIDITERRATETLGGPRIESLVYSPDGAFVVATIGSWNRGGKRGEVRIYDAATRHLIGTLLDRNKHVVTCAAFSANGSKLAAATADGRLVVWSVSR